MGHVEQQRRLCRRLVHMLPTRPAAAGKAKFNFRQRDVQVGVDDDRGSLIHALNAKPIRGSWQLFLIHAAGLHPASETKNARKVRCKIAYLVRRIFFSAL